MKLIKHILLIPLFLVILCCEKDKEKIQISGFTIMDESANQTGEIDTTDWRLDDVWSTEIINLFNITSFKSTQINLNDSNGLKYSVDPVESRAIHAYPNPFNEVLNLIKPAGEMEVIIVDEELNIFLSTRVSDSNFTLNMTSSNFISGKAYRIYYQLLIDSDTFRRGHGDIKKD